MIYPIVVHKDKDSDFGVTVPDLPGCFSAGSTLDEAVAMAREAIELHLEGLIADGQVIPQPHSIESHRSNPDYRGGIWALVNVDTGNLRIHAKRINVTIPQRVLDAVDRVATAEHETRSGLLTKAASEYVNARKKLKLKKDTSHHRFR
ncbi:MAG TPA: type II toxin-antitoxin system HicB family antitoxin [Phycisphaerae bacterium]|nr:type II toxin-antitoxin system HicB family antitoxin [Phycisphaerae bacterium]